MNFKSGNQEETFREFYEKTHAKAYQFARKHTASEVLSEEILQTAYLKIWEKRHQIAPQFIAFKSYLYTTIRNLVIKEYRRQVAEQDLLLQFKQLQQETSEVSDTEELLAKVHQLVNTLPTKQQEVFRLVKLEGKTYRETASALSIAESTVEKHIIKALRTLRERLSGIAYHLFF